MQRRGMRILIVSLGSIGRRHLANFRRLEPTADIVVWRRPTAEALAAGIPAEANRVVFSLDDALATKPDVAVIASPASCHVGVALALAAAGVHILVEKPLSHTMAEVDALLSLCDRRSLVLMVAYNLRFYRPLQIAKECLESETIGKIMSVRAEVGQFLPEWRANNYRAGVSARRDLGGGVLLELSHEFDYLRWLVGEVESLTAETAHLSDLDIDTEDVAEVILRFGNGAMGSVHMNMVQQPASRGCRIVGTTGTLVWDGMTHRVSVFSAATRRWTDLHPACELDRNVSFEQEAAHFLACVQRHVAPTVTGDAGRRALQLALAAKASAASRRAVSVAEAPGAILS